MDTEFPRAERPSRNAPSLTSIGFLMHLAMARLRDGVAATLEGAGLHPGLLAIVGALSDCGGLSQKRLGEVTHVEKSTMVIYIDALEAQGWVVRERDPHDRRAHRVTLTPFGRDEFHRLAPRLAQNQADFLQPLSAQEHETLVDLLTRLGAG